MSNFTIKNLTGERALVRGTDAFGTEGSTVLDTTQWNAVKAHKAFDSASSDFDASVQEFFAPLVAAAEKLEAAGLGKKMDNAEFVVLHEGTEPVEAVAPVIEHLGKDAVVLRLIEAGQGDRLVWVGDSLEVLSVEDDTAALQEAAALLASELGAVEVDATVAVDETPADEPGPASTDTVGPMIGS